MGGFERGELRARRVDADEPTALDPYGAEAIDEFFAVASEAYFVNRERFGQDFGALLPWFDAYFRPGSKQAGLSDAAGP